MTLLNNVCQIRWCAQPARYNVEVIGHPNGDVAAAYCHKHAEERGGGMWDESPRPYTKRITGPFGPPPAPRELGPEPARCGHVRTRGNGGPCLLAAGHAGRHHDGVKPWGRL